MADNVYPLVFYHGDYIAQLHARPIPLVAYDIGVSPPVGITTVVWDIWRFKRGQAAGTAVNIVIAGVPAAGRALLELDVVNMPGAWHLTLALADIDTPGPVVLRCIPSAGAGPPTELIDEFYIMLNVLSRIGVVS